MTTTPHGASALIHDVTPDTAAELDRLAEQREIERRTGPSAPNGGSASGWPVGSAATPSRWRA
jgi:hypothetical protein